MFWACVLLALMPWLVYQWPLSLNANVSWMLIAAGRLIDGGTMLTHAYEPNPPLNIILYMPPVLLARLADIPLWHALTLYMLCLTVLSVYAAHRLLLKIPDLPAETARILTAGFIAGATIIFAFDYGEREHFILLGLWPLVLCQCLLTMRIRASRPLLWPALLLGALAINIKPHFGLVPAVVLLHRLWLRKKPFSFLRDTDFWILSLVTTGYVLFCLALFPDYVSGVLPDVIRLYAGNLHYEELRRHGSAYIIVFVFFLGILPFLDLGKKDLRWIFALLFLSLLCFIPFIVQKKGFVYHLLPAAAFLLMALGLILKAYIVNLRITASWMNLVVALSVILASYFLVPPRPEFPTHADYPALPLPAYVHENVRDRPYFIFLDSMGMIHQTALYIGQEHGSRFPSYWFIPGLLHAEAEDPERARRLKEKYAGMVAEDLAYYKPALLLIQKLGDNWRLNGKVVDFHSFFSGHDTFDRQWALYERLETRVFDYGAYFRGTNLGGEKILEFDIYKRVDFEDDFSPQ